jgi:anti-sigma B factor antagonist
VGNVAGIRNPLVINGLPVLAAPADMDIIAAERLHAVLLDLAANGHSTVVVDMTHTEFCDSTTFGVLVGAHKRALASGGEARVVIPADSTIFRIFTLVGLDRHILWFASLDHALAQSPRPEPGPATPVAASRPVDGAVGQLPAAIAGRSRPITYRSRL